MNATVEAATIAATTTGIVGFLGIVATVTTAIVSSRNTKRATERTVAGGVANTRATLMAAQEGRFWEQERAAYEETLAASLHRQTKRREDLRNARWDGATEQQITDALDSYDPPGIFEARARLVAYATDEVLAAFEAASRAHETVRSAYAHRVALRESLTLAQASGRLEGIPDPETMTKAKRQLDGALEAAGAADDMLIDTIRIRLRSKPEAALQPLAGLPAVHRRFWLRRRG